MYCVTKKSLSKLCRHKKRMLKTNVLRQFQELNSRDPNEFWKLLSKDKKHIPLGDDSPSIDDWFSHFKNLNEKSSSGFKFDDKHAKVNEELKKFIENDLPLSCSVEHEIFNAKITPAETLSVLKSLKNNKGVGPDGICNEILKHGKYFLCGPLTNFFNLIFDAGMMPNEWHESFLIPIHKKGSTSDPNNNRGISLSSCVSKVFLLIMKNRLEGFVENNQLLATEQLGFVKGYRTSDNFYVLKSVVNRQLHVKNKKLFTAFIDFRKAFDSVWREGLLLKLVNKGIDGKLFRIILNLYTSSECRVRTEGSYSKTFSSNIGVKQGCVLSPILFNLFLSDLPEFLKNSHASEINLEFLKISLLIYADDLVLFSKSAEGLQQSLDALSEYCKLWGLIVNPDKSKIMIFNKSKNFHFHIDENIIEIVKSFTYLGYARYQRYQLLFCFYRWHSRRQIPFIINRRR
jgi:hypothetical protein